MPENGTEDPREPSVEELVEETAEGLWLRLRDVMLVEQRLERFVF